MKAKDLHNKTGDELKHLLGELQSKMAQMQFDHAENKLKDTMSLQKSKRDIARILTVLRTK